MGGCACCHCCAPSAGGLCLKVAWGWRGCCCCMAGGGAPGEAPAPGACASWGLKPFQSACAGPFCVCWGWQKPGGGALGPSGCCCAGPGTVLCCPASRGCCVSCIPPACCVPAAAAKHEGSCAGLLLFWSPCSCALFQLTLLASVTLGWGSSCTACPASGCFIADGSGPKPGGGPSTHLGRCCCA
jgi:hypothetical protein